MQHITRMSELDTLVSRYKYLAMEVEKIAESDSGNQYTASNNLEKNEKYGFMYSISGKRAEAAIASDKSNEAKRELIEWLKTTPL